MRSFQPDYHSQKNNLTLSIERIHDVKNESEDIQGNYAIMNPNRTAHNGGNNTDKNGPRYWYEDENALCAGTAPETSLVRTPKVLKPS